MQPVRTRLAALAVAAATIVSSAGILPASEATVGSLPTGLTRLLTHGTPTGRAIATFTAPPTTAQVSSLRSLGLTVQPMKQLPLALVAGDLSAIKAAVTAGVVRDVYPDERLRYADTASSNVTSSSPAAARALRTRGLTGKGVTVGVIDSGCDATHPDLAKRVVHNVTLVSAEYANQPPTAGNTLVVPLDKGPYSNTDLGSGHGTHVAGIIAADGTSGPSHLGVAPAAKLACFSIGAVLTTTAVVTAFDYILRQPGRLGIDVINNSWGNSFRQFDPADPVNVATKATTAKGITVVFAAGNSGAGNAQASVSPFNQAPWVISVAAGTLTRQRGGFSSNGLRYDNTQATAIGRGGHTVALGDRIGLVHPDITAPGVDVASSCAATGTLIGPCLQHGDEKASGTSMASPHIAGAAAVLEQAQPRLTPAQVRTALQATATPVMSAGASPKALPFWQVGYGHVNLDKAVALVRSSGWATKLALASRRANARVLAADGWSVVRSDTWQRAAPPVAIGGSDTRTVSVPVGRLTRRLHVTLVYPTPGILANLALYTATVTDPAGKVVGTSKTSVDFSHGTATVTIPVTRVGTYRVKIVGDRAVSDPDTIDSDSINGRVVYVNAAQVAKS